MKKRTDGPKLINRAKRSPLEKKQEDSEIEALGIEQRLDHPGYYIRRLHQISVAIFLGVSEQFDVTQIQYAALLTINCTPGIDQVTLGRVVALDRQTTSSVVRRLTEKGLISKRMRNGRTNELHITKDGLKLIGVMTPHEYLIDGTLMKPLSLEERNVFMTLLKRLVDDNNALSRVPSRVADSEKKPAG